MFHSSALWWDQSNILFLLTYWVTESFCFLLSSFWTKDGLTILLWHYHSFPYSVTCLASYEGGFSSVRLLVSPGGGNPILRICSAVDPLHPRQPWPPAARTGKQSALFYLQASSVPIGELSQMPLCLVRGLQNRLLSMPKRRKQMVCGVLNDLTTF